MQGTIQNVEVMLLYDLHYRCQWRTFLNEKKVMKPSANTSHKTDDSMSLTITGPSFSAGILRDRLPCSAPISLQWFSLYLSFSIICKATTVTHTKRIDRNLLREETSFVCYTSSVLRKSRHMKQKKKLRTVAKIKTQDYKNWRLQNFFTIVTPPLNTATTLFNEHRSQRPLGTSDRHCALCWGYDW